ncbi:hypothetical protein [Candidatus Protochlamydia sp. W-9]|uniref:hypothetical protein n=1 Tax=Candidatus Protochlamydia sp. W-9 TaxID=1785087 RepID=UPI00096AB344|nr:hypothetical protein [Candidatus Protochlamydia sp. W-9]
MHNGEIGEVLNRKEALSVKEKNLYSTGPGIVQLNKKGISLAIDRRAALFFQQIISCYKMSDFIFSARGADDQIGSSPKLKFSSKKGKSIIHKREAAHSSTIPTLIAHAKDGSTPSGFVYLKGGSCYDQHNATVGMHECVNGADELIDGNGQDKKLRETAVKILNLVAGGLDPMLAMRQFFEAFESQIAETMKTLDADDFRKHVLEKYQQKIVKIKTAAKHKEFYDRLLGVIIDSNDNRERKIREVTYKKRCEVILLQDVVESRIGKRIDEVRKNFEVRERKFLEYALLKEFSNTDQRQILEKLFGKTAAIFEEEFKKNNDGTQRIQGKNLSDLKRFHISVDKLKVKYKVQIQSLTRSLRADFRELSCAEMSYRSSLFKDLRKRVNNWTQVKFCEEYHKKIGHTISQAWVSRREQLSRLNLKIQYKTSLSQRRHLITLGEAINCAKTFNVEAGLFLPGLITS